jgi:hypothetical protein
MLGNNQMPGGEKHIELIDNGDIVVLAFLGA